MKKILLISMLMISKVIIAATPIQSSNYAGINVVPVNTSACRAAFKKNLYAYQIDATYGYTVSKFNSIIIDGITYQSATIKGKLKWPLNLEDKFRYADYWLSNNLQAKTDNLVNLNVVTNAAQPKALTLKVSALKYNAALRARAKREIDNHIPCVKFQGVASNPRLDMDPVSESFDATMGFSAVEKAYPMTTTRPIAIIDTQLTDAIYAPHRLKLIEPFSAVPKSPAYTTDLTFKTHMDTMFHIVSQVTGDAMIQPIYGIKGGGTSNVITLTESSIGAAVDKAISDNAKAISNSWDVYNGNNDVTIRKFAQAYRKGIMIVQAAGNTGNYNPNKPKDNNIMVVGLVSDFAGKLSFPSDRGEFGPDIVVKVKGSTTYPITHQADYGTASVDYFGSSGATAFMAGLVARFKDDLSPDQIKKCIYDTADKIPLTGEGSFAGSSYIKHGIVNPAKALEACKTKPPAIIYNWVANTVTGWYTNELKKPWLVAMSTLACTSAGGTVIPEPMFDKPYRENCSIKTAKFYTDAFIKPKPCSVKINGVHVLQYCEIP